MSEERPESVIQATFSDWRTVKSRKILQLVFEIPLEQQAEALTMLGAPMPDRETWCAIALLRDPGTVRESRRPEEASPATPEPPAGANNQRAVMAKEHYASLDNMERAVADAGMLASDPAFQEWIGRHRGWRGPPPIDAAVAAALIRNECNIISRSELATSKSAYDAFQRLRTTFEIETGRMAAPR